MEADWASILYIGVYLGEALSGQIATAFSKTNTPWNSAMKAIGIVGVVIAVLIRLLLREPARRPSILQNDTERMVDQRLEGLNARFARAKFDLTSTFGHVLRMRSFWLLTLCSGARQLSGNVFGECYVHSPSCVESFFTINAVRVLYARLPHRHLPIGD